MRLRIWGMLAFLLLIASNLAGASSNAPVPPVCSPNFDWSKVALNDTAGLGLSLLALTVSFDAVAIAFALSRLFPNLGIRNWLQSEYWEIAKTALIIVSIFAVMTLVGNLSYFLVPKIVTSQVSFNSVSGLTPLVAGSERYLCGVNTNLVNTWDELGILAEGTGVWSTLQVGFYIPIPIADIITIYDGVSFLPFANWLLQTGNFFIAAYGSIINDLINFILFPFTSITLGLITALPSLAYVGFTFFIPMGLVFRAFPFIRGIGGTLIAVGLALCLVLPTVFILFNYQATSILSNAIPIVQPTPSTVNLGCHLPTLAGTLICGIPNLVLSVFNSVPNFIGDVLYTFPVFQTNAIYTYMDRIMRYGLYIIVQMLLFSIDLVIMYPLVDNIARAMGGSIKLSLGGKLRLAS